MKRFGRSYVAAAISDKLLFFLLAGVPATAVLGGALALLRSGSHHGLALQGLLVTLAAALFALGGAGAIAFLLVAAKTVDDNRESARLKEQLLKAQPRNERPQKKRWRRRKRERS